MSLTYLEARTAKAWGIPWGKWEEMEPVDKAVMMATDIAESKMESWENVVRERNNK